MTQSNVPTALADTKQH